MACVCCISFLLLHTEGELQPYKELQRGSLPDRLRGSCMASTDLGISTGKAVFFVLPVYIPKESKQEVSRNEK